LIGEAACASGDGAIPSPKIRELVTTEITTELILFTLQGSHFFLTYPNELILFMMENRRNGQ
jgi:hypothetical protein